MHTPDIGQNSAYAPIGLTMKKVGRLCFTGIPKTARRDRCHHAIFSNKRLLNPHFTLNNNASASVLLVLK